MTRFEEALLATRTTLDVDVTVWAEEAQIPPLIQRLGEVFHEESAIRRARLMSVAGERIRVCTPEDLIVLKILSDRPRDREDVAGIIRTQGAGLDRGYLDPLIQGLAADMGRPDLLDFYRRCLGGGLERTTQRASR